MRRGDGDRDDRGGGQSFPALAAEGGEAMRLEDLGEFELIDRLTQLTSSLGARADVALGIGDDAALLDPGGESLVAATIDALVEGRHFLLSSATPEEIGHKALAVNLSDLAAMGAEPCWALVSLLVPPSLEVSILDGVYAGLRDEAHHYGVAVVGGNVAATDGPLTIDVVALGRCPRGAQVTRAGGSPGDLLLVTGSLGAAAAGLLVARDPKRAEGVARNLQQRAHDAMVAPTPRVAAGQALAAGRLVTAMIDISDGLAADLGHLCARSRVGAELDASLIPVDPAAMRIASRYGQDSMMLALHGGEEYELLCAVAPESRDGALAALRAVGCAPVVIGRLTAPASGMTLQRSDGSLETLSPRGWDHLRSV
jgi:thiamine-monophosphate kinase